MSETEDLPMKRYSVVVEDRRTRCGVIRVTARTEDEADNIVRDLIAVGTLDESIYGEDEYETVVLSELTDLSKYDLQPRKP